MNADKTLPEAHSSVDALICIPAYNEEENIGAILDDIIGLESKARYDILVVDDGSVDGTRAVCEACGVCEACEACEACGARRVTVISHIFNLGYGAALKTAYKYATENGYQYLIQLDADGQHDAANVDGILAALSGANRPDIVIGSRFHQDGDSFHVPFYKKIIISFFRFLIALGTGNRITDPTSGLQGLSRRAFTFYAQYDRFALDFPDANMIIQMALNRFAIEEIPAVMHPRVKGVSMHTGKYKQFKYIVKMVISVLIVYMREASASKKVSG